MVTEHVFMQAALPDPTDPTGRDSVGYKTIRFNLNPIFITQVKLCNHPSSEKRVLIMSVELLLTD